MKKTVLRFWLQMRSSSRFICSRVIASSAPNGSSISSRRGSCTSARTIAARCCMPPDSSIRIALAKSCRPTSSSRSSAPAAGSAIAQLAELDRQQHVVDHRPPRQQHRRLEHDGRFGARPAQRFAVEFDRSRRIGQQPGQHLEQRRFPAAALADDRDELAVVDLEIEILERRHLVRFAAPYVLETPRATMSGCALSALVRGETVAARIGFMTAIGRNSGPLFWEHKARHVPAVLRHGATGVSQMRRWPVERRVPCNAVQRSRLDRLCDCTAQ